MKQDFVFVKNRSRFDQLRFDDILYIKNLRNGVRIVTKDQTFRIHESMFRVYNLLPKESFARIHISYIVPIKSIKAFDREYVWLAIREGERLPGKKFPIGKKFIGEMKRSLKIVENLKGLRMEREKLMAEKEIEDDRWKLVESDF